MSRLRLIVPRYAILAAPDNSTLSNFKIDSSKAACSKFKFKSNQTRTRAHNKVKLGLVMQVGLN